MRELAFFLLRAGLAFAFIYPAVSAWSDPFTWLGYVPSFAAALWPFSNMSLLHTFGFIEIGLALWVLWGKKLVVPCSLMTFILLFIVVTNLDQFDILFRDLSLAAVSLAFVLLHWQKKEVASVEQV